MQDILTFLIVFGAIAGVIGAFVFLIWWHQKKRERERMLALKSSATLLGWQFAETAPPNYIANLERFPLFNSGHSKQIKNMMYGDWNGVKAALFDYIYTVGHGKNSHTHYQSVAYFEARNLNLPSFSLRPEGLLHKLISAFGYQDIDFGNRPTFSSQYLLRGTDETAIRNTFGDHLLAWYETNPGTCTDGGGNQLFIFRQGFRTPPHEAQSFVDRAFGVTNLFARS